MQLSSQDIQNLAPIPERFAFGRIGDASEPCLLSDNLNPQLYWSDIPAGTLSFALSCIDVDAPTRADDVNKPGRFVPASLPRCEFVHWLMANIPADCRELSAGSSSDAIHPGGKSKPGGPAGTIHGLNDYSGWFAGDAAMGGRYLGYDGPCPPWNDTLVHHYHFRVYALDVARLDLGEGFTLAQFRAAIAGHVLAEAELVGTYTLNPGLR
jgi:Raf kinase inhibitor-like YbhB/YbcL family protein